MLSCLYLPYQYNGLRGCILQLFTHLGVTNFTERILASLCYCVVLLLIKCCNQSILDDKTMHNKKVRIVTRNLVFLIMCCLSGTKYVFGTVR